MHAATLLALRSITTAGWVIALLTILPIGGFVTDDVRNLALSVAIVGSIALIVDRLHGSTRAVVQEHQRPAIEVYEAGKAIGRAELLREQAAGDAVVSLEDRRRALPRRGLSRAVNDS